MRKSTSIFLVTFLLMVLGLLCSCSQNSNEPLTYPLEISVDEGQIFLYNPFNYRLGIYDLELMRWDEIDEQDAFFQSFDWGNVYPYVVFGQNDRLFHAGKFTDTKLQFYFTLENKQQALTPFAADSNLLLYIIAQGVDEDCVRRIVTISEDGKLKLIADLDGMPVSGGVIAGDFLYFTSYNEDTSLLDVWRINLTKPDTNQKPELIQKNYTSSRLYQYKRQVLFLDLEKQILYSDAITIELSQRADLIMIDDEVNILAEMYVNQDMKLELAFTDISSGQILGTYPGAINFTREGSVITIYGNGFIEELNLSEGE
jgi:hypothetical protein